VLLAFLVKRLYIDTNEYMTLTYHSQLKDCKRLFATGRGNEDIAVHHKSGTAFVSWVFLREVFSDRTKQADNAGIYLVDLNAKDLVLLKAELVNFNAVLHPHGIAVLEENEKVYLFVVNHREAEYVEIFEFKDKKLYHVSSVTSPDFVSLNDVYPVSC